VILVCLLPINQFNHQDTHHASAELVASCCVGLWFVNSIVSCSVAVLRVPVLLSALLCCLIAWCCNVRGIVFESAAGLIHCFGRVLLHCDVGGFGTLVPAVLPPHDVLLLHSSNCGLLHNTRDFVSLVFSDCCAGASCLQSAFLPQRDALEPSHDERVRSRGIYAGNLARYFATMPEESVNSLQYAFIFDRRLDVADESAEDQEKLEQVLYFWPTNTPAFQQNVRVSLCSGVLDFCHSFSGEAIVDGVQMEEQYYSFFECEKDIWMVWVVSNPKQLVISGRRKGTLSKTEQMRNIFHPDTLRDHLRSVHDLYRLFHGSLRSAIAPDGDLSIMHDLMAKRRQLRKALEMQEKLADEAVARTEANLSRAQAASTFQRELKAMEAGSTVTKVRRQLRQIVSQFMNASFTQRWDHHAFGYLRDVVRSQVSRFTLLSVQYFSSTVKTGVCVCVCVCWRVFDMQILVTSLLLWCDMLKDSTES